MQSKMRNTRSVLAKSENRAKVKAEGKSTTSNQLSDKDKDAIKKQLEKDMKAERHRDVPDPKPIVPEQHRRRIDEGIGGTREDWYKNRRKYDG
jgi:hypothetical protein